MVWALAALRTSPVVAGLHLIMFEVCYFWHIIIIRCSDNRVAQSCFAQLRHLHQSRSARTSADFCQNIHCSWHTTLLLIYVQEKCVIYSLPMSVITVWDPLMVPKPQLATKCDWAFAAWMSLLLNSLLGDHKLSCKLKVICKTVCDLSYGFSFLYWWY